MKDKRRLRLVRLVDALKRGLCVTTTAFAHRLDELDATERLPLSASAKTVSRDIQYLRDTWKAPLEYDATAHGYRLTDRSWRLPHLYLEGDDLFTALFSARVSEPLLPSALLSGLETVRTVQLAAGIPEDLDPDLLNSVVLATGSVVTLDPDTAAIVIKAWRAARRLSITYIDADSVETRREVDVQALFLSGDAWYAKVFCHLRQDWRSFALHRISAAKILNTVFDRSTQIVDEVRGGHVFDYTPVPEVTVTCIPGRARYFRERIWFPGQRITDRPDGTLEVYYPTVAPPLFVPWVMAFMGEVTIQTPACLRNAVAKAAARLTAAHA